ELRRRGRLPQVAKQLGCFVEPRQSLLERGGRRAHRLRRELGQEGPETLCELAVAQGADVMAVDPVELIPVEHRARLLPPCNVEGRQQFLEAEDLLLGPRVPAQQGQVVEKRLGQVAAPLVKSKTRLRMQPLAQLLAVVADDYRQVGIGFWPRET